MRHVKTATTRPLHLRQCVLDRWYDVDEEGTGVSRVIGVGSPRTPRANAMAAQTY